jgi:hypothetical protein
MILSRLYSSIILFLKNDNAIFFEEKHVFNSSILSSLYLANTRAKSIVNEQLVSLVNLEISQ